MQYVTRLADHVGTRPDKFFKATLFRGEALLLGVNCLEPGQVQAAHDHADQDKFYYVIEGRGVFRSAMNSPPSAKGRWSGRRPALFTAWPTSARAA